MTIYVDEGGFPFRGRRWCHLFTDGDDAELHAFAAQLGLRREWFQKPPRASWRHYDLVVEKRPAAIRLGAQIADRIKLVEVSSGTRAARQLALQISSKG